MQAGWGQKVISPEHADQFELKIQQSQESGFSAYQSIGNFELIEKLSKEQKFFQIHSDKLMKTFHAGYPELPVVSKLIEMPVGSNVKINIHSYQVETIDLKEKGMDALIFPAQPSKSKSQGKDNRKFHYDKLVYGSDKFIGDELVQVEDLGVMRYLRFGRLQIAPFKYNPVQNKLKIYNNIQFEVEFSASDHQKAGALIREYSNPYFRNAEENAINSEAFLPKNNQTTSSPVTYVIISDRKFEDALQPFIEWKKLKGFHVITEYTDIIGSTNSEIKTFLEDLYQNPDPTAPSFVLFVGDTEQIPAWPGQAADHITDFYYCEYTGDHLPEVYYGRFSAQTKEELQSQVEKTLKYEKFQMAQPEYLKEALLVAGNDESMEDIYGNGAMWYADNYYFTEENGIRSHLFLQDPPISNGAVRDSIIRNINQGVGYANYTAHCSSAGWSNPFFSTADVEGLTNEGQYGLWVGNCCQSLKFDEPESFGEAALRAPKKGAVGYIGGSNFTYWDEDYWWGVGTLETPVEQPTYEETGQGVYDGMFHTKSNEVSDPSSWYITQGQISVCGNLAVEASTSSLKTYYWEIYHLMGDPALMPYLGMPGKLDADHSPFIEGMDSAVIQTEPHAYAALSHSGQLLDASMTDENGEAVLHFSELTGAENIILVITAQNKQPLIDTLLVQPNDRPYVKPESVSFVDSLGNNNQSIDYGDTIDVNAVLRNYSDKHDALNVVDTILCNNQSIELLDSTHFYGTIPKGESKEFMGICRFLVSDTITDQEQITLQMYFSGKDTASNLHTWPFELDITVNAPDLKMGKMRVIDSTGSGEGILDPGETAELQFELINAGHAAIADVIGQLSLVTGNAYITLDKSTDGPLSVGPGDTALLNFQVSSDGSTPLDTTLTFHMAVSGGPYGFYSAQTDRELTIGDIPKFLISDQGPLEACSGWFYDSGGGASNYSNNEHSVLTLYPYFSGEALNLYFSELNIEEDFDWLKIYDGKSPSSSLIGKYDSGNRPDTIRSMNASGALTFEFSSDGSVTQSGWTAGIECTERNEITFIIQDSTNQPIQGAEIGVEGRTFQSNEKGEVIVLLDNGTYSYVARKTGFNNMDGKLEVSRDTSLLLSLEVSTYNLTLNVWDEDRVDPVDAEVKLDDTSAFTVDGSYTFTDVPYELEVPLEIQPLDDYFQLYRDTIDVTTDKEWDIVLSPVLYPTTFYVVDEAGTPLEGANFRINGFDHTTASDGSVTLQLSEDKHLYNVSFEEYMPVRDSIFIDGESSVYTDTIRLSPQTYELGFLVRDSHNNEAITGAVIQVDTANCQTDTEGFGSLWLPKGFYEYSIKANGYKDHQGTQFLTSSVHINIQMESLESTIEEEYANSILVYPNPTQGMIDLHIPRTPARLIIYTASGQIMHSRILEDEKESINLKDKEPGIYILKIQIENQVYYKKLLKTE